MPPFDQIAFALKKNEISAPVHSQYGWHIIQALSDVTPREETPLKDVKEQIRQNSCRRRRPTR